MSRITGVTDQQAGLQVKIAYFFTRRMLAQLAGRSVPDGIEPLRVYARVPGLLKGIGSLEQATAKRAKLRRLDDRIRALAELRAATLTQCEYCIDLGSAVSRGWGLADAELLALPGYRTSELFSDVDKLVLDYATGMSTTPVDVPDELFARLRAHFDDDQLLELTHVIALENMRGRFNLALGVGAAGYSDGLVCAVPATAPASTAQPGS
jgi:AhpD family alkylhydroperoxidase